MSPNRKPSHPWNLCLMLLFGTLLAGLGCSSKAQANERDMKGKVYAGYQGWFAAPGDGTPAGFDNYQVPFQGGFSFEPGASAIDLWPDLSEFTEDEKFPTPFQHEDGRQAHVFSSAHPETVDRHFKWMSEYGIDGVFLQRFAWMLDREHILKHRSRVLDSVRKSSQQHQREWALMYDLSAVDADFIRKHLIADFKQLVDQDDPRQAPTYIQHHGKPVVAIWGIGFSDERDYGIDVCMELVRFFKDDPVYGGNAVMLGVPYYWRGGDRDAVDDPKLKALFKACDIISPWSVGRYDSPEEAEQIMGETLPGDMRWASEHEVGYLPVVFPGFSWQNLEKAKGRDSELGSIPRLGGKFLWQQARLAKQAGAQMVYLAMFDELNEGTAIMKCTNDPPVGRSAFLTYNGLPSDHYLWLSGQVGRLFRGELPADAPMPKRDD
ncbi:MAG: glycoside hydrolase family 71/99-like protein [Planctomycetota bacterium]